MQNVRKNIFNFLLSQFERRRKIFKETVERLRKRKRFLIYDFGLCTEVAERIARDGHEVYYFVPWQDAFPEMKKAIIGEGLVKRVKYFWDYVDKVDYICFFDTHTHDIAEYLRERGYKVFAPFKAELLELDRIKGRQVQKVVGLPTQKTTIVKGLDNLKRYLQKVSDKWIKLNTFRGTIETWHHKNFDASEAQFLEKLGYDLGPKRNDVEFLIEDSIEGVEPGFDGMVVDGNYLSPCMYGYEAKGAGYIGRVVPYKKLPQPLKEINDKLSIVFQKTKARTFFSTEVRVTKEKRGYLIDPTIRLPMPVPGAIELEIFENIVDAIINACEGKITNLRPLAKYGAGVCLESEWAENNWLNIEFPKNLRRWIKFRMVCKLNGKYYAVPGFSSICSVIAIGNSIEEVVRLVKERVKMVSGRELDTDAGGLDLIVEEIKKGKKFGIKF